MLNDLSRRVRAIKPSPTLAVSNLASQLRAQGRNVIGLGAGEPDFDTPQHIRDAAIEAIHNGDTPYTAADDVANLLLEEVGVALVPGSAFGARVPHLPPAWRTSTRLWQVFVRCLIADRPNVQAFYCQRQQGIISTLI